MEATCSSKTSVDFQRTTWCYIHEHKTLNNHHCENLKSYMSYFIFSGVVIVYFHSHGMLKTDSSNF
jgi:hypothetical protein